MEKLLQVLPNRNPNQRMAQEDYKKLKVGERVRWAYGTHFSLPNISDRYYEVLGKKNNKIKIKDNAENELSIGYSFFFPPDKS